MVQVTHLTKSYGAHAALDDISFKLEKGKIYGLLGPNGAGKSTLMNILTGYLEPDGGQVVINDIDLLRSPLEAKKHIGYLPEVPPLYGDMTAEEFLNFAARLRHIPRPERPAAVRSAMERAEIGELSGRLIKNLSKGYRQRVGLAWAILGGPELLILDEPSAGLDPRQMAEMRGIIKGFAGKSAVLVSSHILRELESMCHELLLICRGKLVAMGDAAQLGAAANARSLLELTVRGGAEKTGRALSEIPSRPKWTLSEEGADACVFTVEAGDGQDPREEIFYALSRADCPILEMKPVQTSLEELFLRLTDGGGL